MTGILRKIAALAYRHSPRMRHAVIWGWPDWEDSVVALEEALQDTDVRTVIVLMSDPASPPPSPTGKKTRRVKKNSLAGWLWFCSARHVFFTHPCFTKSFPRDVVSVNVWHGMPIKKIGWMIEDDPGITASITLATSPFWAEVMERAMEPGGAVLPLGLPRNDRLFSCRSSVFKKLGLPEGRKLAAWLPTYRKSVRGLARTDGIEAGNVFEMPDIDPDALNEHLVSRNAVMVVKPHPMARFDRGGEWSHLLIVDDNWLRRHGLSLYELLGATDLLISDISSVVIDYLLLDRPIIHAFPDLREYEASRGFTVEPIENYFCGPVAGNFPELMEALEASLSGTDPGFGRRERMRGLCHTHTDGNSTQKLLEAAGLKAIPETPTAR